MSWERFLDDLEGRFDDEEARLRGAEVAERIRAERARVHLGERLLAHEGELELVLLRGRLVGGRVVDGGDGWLVVAESSDREVLVPAHALVEIAGLGREVAPPRAAHRLGMGHAMRRLARDRQVVAVEDVIGRVLTGTISSVGADMFELARHAPELPPRREHVIARPVLPFSAVLCVVSDGGGLRPR